MRDYDQFAADISSLYGYYIYKNLIQSILWRKQGRVDFSPEDRSAMISWGISTFIGGEFSESNREKVVSMIEGLESPRFLYFPDDEWRSYVKSALSDKLNDKTLHVYQFENAKNMDLNEDGHIVPITRGFMEKNLPNSELLTDELYSYTDMEDFYQNGFGLALVMDGVVSGFCLSEYSINNSHGINIWIDEPYRRAGYARKMVNTFLAHCQEKNQNTYWVCDADNIPSNKLAASSGFVLKSAMPYFEL